MSGTPKIPDGPDGRVVRDYFRAMNLDPLQPEHWFALLKALIDQSRNRAKVGAPKKWTTDKLVRLSADFGRIKHDKPKKSDSDICRILARRDLYKKQKWQTLRRVLYEAKNPERNEFLARLLDALMAQYKNPREELLAFLTGGIDGTLDVYEDDEGNIMTRLRGIELVRK
jgi:hypothetical protein